MERELTLILALAVRSFKSVHQGNWGRPNPFIGQKKIQRTVLSKWQLLAKSAQTQPTPLSTSGQESIPEKGECAM